MSRNEEKLTIRELRASALGVLGTGVLLAGAAVYPARQEWFSEFLTPLGIAWLAGGSSLILGSFPTFAHVFAFSLLTFLAGGRRPALAIVAPLLWVAVNLVFELGQHTAVATPLASWFYQHLPGGPGDLFADYFELGTFDVADAVAGLAGGAMAHLVLRHALQGPPSEQA